MRLDLVTAILDGKYHSATLVVIHDPGQVRTSVVVLLAETVRKQILQV